MTSMQVGNTSLYQRVTLRKLAGVDIAFALICLLRTNNDKAYTSPQLFGQFFNFRIFIQFFIYEVKKPSKF